MKMEMKKRDFFQDRAVLLCGIQMTYPEAFGSGSRSRSRSLKFHSSTERWRPDVKCRSYINITAGWLFLQCGNLVRASTAVMQNVFLSGFVLMMLL